MKIRNVNVSRDLIDKILDLDVLLFVLDVIRPLEEELYSHLYRHELDCECDYCYPNRVLEENIRIIPRIDYEYIATLVHTVPIYLIEKGALPEENLELEGESPEENLELEGESPEENLELEGEKCIDFLGAYFQNIRQNNESNPYIELYVDRIYDYANQDDKKFKWLFAITLIHELAHAVLDNYNSGGRCLYVNKLRHNSDFRKWREESMANAIALKVIKACRDKDFYNYAKNFMLSQPPEYALGVLMEKFGYWDVRSVVDNKYEGVDQTLQDQWLDYVKRNPDWQGLKKWNEKLLGLE